MHTQIHGPKGESSYFQGRFNGYGQHQWNIKFYGFESDFEIETAQRWALGEHVKLKIKTHAGHVERVRYGFETITELLGREIESHTDGRQGGWLVINAELSSEEIEKITEFVSSCLKVLPEFLKEEREIRAQEAAEIEASRKTCPTCGHRE